MGLEMMTLALDTNTDCNTVANTDTNTDTNTNTDKDTELVSGLQDDDSALKETHASVFTFALQPTALLELRMSMRM